MKSHRQELWFELPYYAIEWGKTLLGFHHGHLRKNEQLPALFAAWCVCSLTVPRSPAGFCFV